MSEIHWYAARVGFISFNTLIYNYKFCQLTLYNNVFVTPILLFNLQCTQHHISVMQ